MQGVNPVLTKHEFEFGDESSLCRRPFIVYVVVELKAVCNVCPSPALLTLFPYQKAVVSLHMIYTVHILVLFATYELTTMSEENVSNVSISEGDDPDVPIPEIDNPNVPIPEPESLGDLESEKSTGLTLRDPPSIFLAFADLISNLEFAEKIRLPPD
ncbi:hypothetical protein CC78DRAFT_579068 [Lojkania enalia]|uniref:Uncharacterized protein n=1 Tax=Lojkania enalia TaxID=147567 RepID=A0A9P4N721_9PLEO|nr:hypothetical protein CC78DRAFT_579068 [Didymosphaeria enalia]